MVYKRYIISIIIILGIGKAAMCQEKHAERKVSVLPVPDLGYSPETKTYVGAVALFTIRNTNDSLTRSSNAKIEFNYTWNKQVIIESGWNYFFPKEEWFSSGRVHYSKYPDSYYGIGFNTPDNNEIKYQSNRFILELNVLRKIKNKQFIGIGINYNDYNNMQYLQNSVFYPELKDANNFGLNAIFLKDSRNNILSPSAGSYFQFSNSFNIASSFYFKTAIDYRNYFSFGNKHSHTLAGRLYHTSIFGNPPFYDYAMIGGDKYARGYFLGRFRDKNFSTLQLEYRMNLFWKIGAALFGGLSMVYDKINHIRNQSFKPNAGAGLRFLVDKNENTNLRVDYAVGTQNQSGFYISFGESF